MPQMSFYNIEKPEDTMGLSTIQPGEMNTRRHITLFEKLLLAIKHNDVSKAELLLYECTADEKEAVINPKYNKLRPLRRYRHSKKCLYHQPPLLFQALLQGEEIFEILLKAGANLYLADQHGWNIVHYLITVSHNISGMEEKCVTIYNRLKILLTAEELDILLKMEDYEALRPLEFAVHLGCIKLFDAILNTDGVYLIKNKRNGFFDVKEYDVTEYESIGSGNRKNKSPLLLLSASDRKILKDEVAVCLLTKGPITDWASAKVKCNIPFVLIWACLRIVCIVCFYVLLGVSVTLTGIWYMISEDIYAYIQYLLNVTLQEQNITLINSSCDEIDDAVDWYGAYKHGRLFLIGILYLYAYCLISTFSDIVEGIISIFYNWNRWKMCFGRSKNLITSAYYYRICQFIFSFCGMIWTVLYIYIPTNTFVDLGLIVLTYVTTWSVLYFIQILPYAGNFVNSIQKMLAIMAQFVFVYAIILIPFPHAFQVLLREEGLCGSVKGFETIGHGVYSVFRIMLNMIRLDHL